MSLQEAYSKTLDRIAEAALSCNRSPSTIQLIAVSKTHPPEAIEALHRLGQLHFGENKVQELTSKMESLANLPLHWHMIGGLQSNKIKYLVKQVDWIHSIANQRALHELEKRAKSVQRIINVCIQVNISNEDQKSGCHPDELEELLSLASTLTWVRTRGLMGIATDTTNTQQLHNEFASLRLLKEKWAPQCSGNVQLSELSMGMTNDLEQAIQEGATMVRVGSALFGKRNYAI